MVIIIIVQNWYAESELSTQFGLMKDSDNTVVVVLITSLFVKGVCFETSGDSLLSPLLVP